MSIKFRRRLINVQSKLMRINEMNSDRPSYVMETSTYGIKGIQLEISRAIYVISISHNMCPERHLEISCLE